MALKQLPLESQSDEALCTLCARPGADAEAVLLERYRRVVRMQARPYFLMGGDHEDLLQEGMIGLLKAARTYSPDRGSSFATYANRCIENALISAVKSAARDKHTPLNTYISLETPLHDGASEDLSLNTADPRLGPEQLVIAREELQECLAAMSSSLSKLESRILGLYLSGLSYTEIAAQVGRPIKSVDNAVQRVRRKLTQLISPGDSSKR